MTLPGTIHVILSLNQFNPTSNEPMINILVMNTLLYWSEYASCLVLILIVKMFLISFILPDMVGGLPSWGDGCCCCCHFCYGWFGFTLSTCFAVEDIQRLHIRINNIKRREYENVCIKLFCSCYIKIWGRLRENLHSPTVLSYYICKYASICLSYKLLQTCIKKYQLLIKLRHNLVVKTLYTSSSLNLITCIKLKRDSSTILHQAVVYPNM